MVYDVTNHKSFEELDSFYESIIENKRDCVIGMVGNKIDLSDYIEVTREEGINFAKSKGLRLILTSAKTQPEGIRQFIKDLIIEYNNLYPEEKINIKKRTSLKQENEENIRGVRDCCGRTIYYPFPERFKARLFPWYSPMFKLGEKKKKKNALI